jgi:hypothetical protein
MARMTRAQAIQDWRAKRLGFTRRPMDGDKDFLYELRKKGLPHNLTPEQYAEAVQKIAKELGL